MHRSNDTEKYVKVA